jgi:hypothetical protein
MFPEERVDAAHPDGVAGGEDTLFLCFLDQCSERYARVVDAELEQPVCRLACDLPPFPLVIAVFGHEGSNVPRFQVGLVPRPDG